MIAIHCIYMLLDQTTDVTPVTCASSICMLYMLPQPWTALEMFRPVMQNMKYL